MVYLKFTAFVSLFTLCSCHYDDAYNSETTIGAHEFSSWMGHIYDNVPLRNLSIPGTHQSLSLYGTSFAKCQTASLEEQLLSGIRAFDIRLRYYEEGQMYVYHGPIYQFLTFTEVLETVTNYLSKYPTEVVIIKIQNDWNQETNHTVYEAAFKSLLDPFRNYTWLANSTNPTVSDLRGQVVFIDNFSQNRSSKMLTNYGISYSAKASSGQDLFNIQDYYSLESVQDLYTKWEKIKDMLIRANTGILKELDQFYVNFLSGYSYGGEYNIPQGFPFFIASGHSSIWEYTRRVWTGLVMHESSDKYKDFPRLNCIYKRCPIFFEGTNILTADELEKNQYEFVGIIMADFPGKRLIKSIISVNKMYIKRSSNNSSSQS